MKHYTLHVLNFDNSFMESVGDGSIVILNQTRVDGMPSVVDILNKIVSHQNESRNSESVVDISQVYVNDIETVKQVHLKLLAEADEDPDYDALNESCIVAAFSIDDDECNDYVVVVEDY